jgi:hypothetical protein
VALLQLTSRATPSQDAVNEEAAQLFQSDPAAFARRVDECVRECDTEVYTAPEDDFEIKCVGDGSATVFGRTLWSGVFPGFLKAYFRFSRLTSNMQRATNPNRQCARPRFSRWQAVEHAEVGEQLLSGAATVPVLPDCTPPRGKTLFLPQVSPFVGPDALTVYLYRLFLCGERLLAAPITKTKRRCSPASHRVNLNRRC